MFGMVSNIFDKVVEEVDEFVDNPIGYAVDSALSPVVNTLDVLEGLTTGELRVMSAAKVGADVAAGMAVSEMIDLLSD